MAWSKWDEAKPEAGTKIIIAASDGSSAMTGLVKDESGLVWEGECGDDLGIDFMRGSIWCALPADYPLAFMERDFDDRDR